MRRSALYSRSPKREPAAPAATAPGAAAPAEAAAAPVPARRSRFAFAQRHERWFALTAGLLIGAMAIALWTQSRPSSRPLTQKDIDGAVLHTLATQTLPSRAAKAYETLSEEASAGRLSRSEAIAALTRIMLGAIGKS